MTPGRVQLKRTKGWKMPPNTVKVDRTTRWGNPFTPKMLCVTPTKGFFVGDQIGVQGAIDLFKDACDLAKAQNPAAWEVFIGPLRGKNLACWCKLTAPCHADILGNLAKL